MPKRNPLKSWLAIIAARRFDPLNVGDGNEDAAVNDGGGDTPLANGPPHAFDVPGPPRCELRRRQEFAVVRLPGFALLGASICNAVFNFLDHGNPCLFRTAPRRPSQRIANGDILTKP